MAKAKNKMPAPATPEPVTPILTGIKIEQPGYTIYLQIPESALECRCSFVPHIESALLTVEKLLDTLKEYAALEMIDLSACEDIVTSAAAGKPQFNVLLASGTAPIPGRDGYFELTASSTAEVQGNDDVMAIVDMYIVQTFVNVVTGDEIGRIIPAVQGTPGRDIRGEQILPPPCNNLSFTLGKHIQLDLESGILSAASIGRFCNLRGEFSVEEEFIVKGDVDFNVGKIDFKGFVEVRGDILDNFDIKATKGLTVRGNIGVCSILSDGDVTFCGMDGQDTGSIVCGGTLRAHHIHSTSIECAGDVIVEAEIHDCNIKTLGRIIVNKDTISGGSYIAQGGIEASKLGSRSARHTTLLVGVDYNYVEELKHLLGQLTATQAEIGEARSLEEITELRKRAAILSEQISTIRGKTVSSANAKINVKKKLHENVKMVLGDVTSTMQKAKDGPITIVENISSGGVRFIPMTSIDLKASDIERAFVLEEKISKTGATNGKKSGN